MLAGSPAPATPRCATSCGQDAKACREARCTTLHGLERRTCAEACEGIAGCASLRTLAYVVTECESDARGARLRQTLEIRRGDCDPVPVMELTAPEPVPDGFDGIGLCRLSGLFRNSPAFVLAGGVQRLGVRPDGSAVVFEVNNDVALLPFGLPSPSPQQGFFFARADGSGLRWLAPASAAPIFDIYPASGGSTANVFPNLPFSPDGGHVVFTDMGPGPAGETAIQIFTLDVATGGPPRQVTHLPSAASPIPGLPATGFPSFLTGDTIGFYSFANPEGLNPQEQLTAFTVRIDGTGLRALPSPVVGSDSHVVTSFAVEGSGGRLATLVLPGTPVNPYPGASGFFGSLINEVFFVNGRHLVQLTDFHRVDTFGLLLDSRRQRAVFVASANPPHGDNPTENCQLFSIDTLGAHLRQLTHFREGDHSVPGCDSGPPPGGCSVSLSTLAREDPATGTIVFDSSCDPFGTNPFGVQLFAVQANGSRLRTLTHARGYVVAPDGSFTTELVGNWDYAPSVR